MKFVEITYSFKYAGDSKDEGSKKIVVASDE
jgi:hypothetical protein